MNDQQLQFPIGKFAPQETYTAEEIAKNLEILKAFPTRLEELVRQFTSEEFNTPYRPGGWTGRQVVHHLADSHSNAYIRTKWTLTESSPTIKAYFEKLWAETPENQLDPMLSVALVIAVHAKWTALLGALSPEELKKGFTHPESGKFVSLERQIALYAWHCEHHLAHLRLIHA